MWTRWAILFVGLVGAVMMTSACSGDGSIPDGRFACGINGGSCEIGTQLCLVTDECSTCVPVPSSCSPADCGCIESAADVAPTLEACLETSRCEAFDDGTEITCSAEPPPFICG